MIGMGPMHSRVSAQLSPWVGWRPFLVILLLANCGKTRPEGRSTFLIDGAACATHFHIGSGKLGLGVCFCRAE
ncbi:hypothetical protein JB92DRAFT_810633 [Gautieria morchelliformis]|nr:hypothetical protein JB92DRAFT_810633 [Gautieria morchelliformis]